NNGNYLCPQNKKAPLCSEAFLIFHWKKLLFLILLCSLLLTHHFFHTQLECRLLLCFRVFLVFFQLSKDSIVVDSATNNHLSQECENSTQEVIIVQTCRETVQHEEEQ